MPATAPEGSLTAGQTIGHYRLDRLLASGGFADVYLARHLVLDQPVALKIVRERANTDRERQGARLMCRLRHPHIVGVHFADLVEGRLVISMDYVPGETLRERLFRRGSFEVNEAIGIATNVCDALQYVHEFDLDGASGFAHLDLKPCNILFDCDGAAKVTDFGLAQVPRAETSPHSAIAGSPAYMAPEQFDGNGGPASDVWAAGVLLHEMLTGELPFDLERGREAARPRMRAASYGRGIPPALLAAIERCLEERPEARFQRAADLRDALHAAVEVGRSHCERCGAPLAPGGMCTDCTVGIFRPKAAPTPRVFPVASTAPKKVKLSVARHRWLAASAMVAASAMAIAGAYGAADVYRGRQSSAKAWAETQGIEQSTDTAYDAKIAALATFEQSWPGRPEAIEAAARRARWQGEARLFAAADAYEHRPDARTSEALRRWQAFLAGQWSDLNRLRAETRLTHWQKRLRSYTGWATLRVISATGLPASDIGLIGDDAEPDPYFVLRLDGRFVYRSLSYKNSPAPVWNESARIHLHPGAAVSVDVVDRNVFVDKTLASVALTSPPPDGRFERAAGSVTFALEIQRER